MLDGSFFPDKFHTNRFTVFRRMVVSSEKITCSKFVALSYLEPVFSIHFGKLNGFDTGRLYLSATSFKCRCIVVLLSTVPRAVTNVCCSTRETICSSCLGIVACARSDRIKSLESFDCFHYCHVTLNCFCYSHMTKLWTY